MFPDIQGAVHFWQFHQSPRFLMQKAQQEVKQGKYTEAITTYDRRLVIELDAQVLTDRAIANCNLDCWDAAHDDLNKAIMLFEGDWTWKTRSQETWAIANYLRGVTFLRRRRWDEALEDLDIAKEKRCNITTHFQNDFDGIAAFEKKYELCLPVRVKEVLTECEAVNETR